jgi:hypothetical protein
LDGGEWKRKKGKEGFFIPTVFGIVNENVIKMWIKEELKEKY